MRKGSIQGASLSMLLGAVLLVLVTGCSRLTFVRPEMGRKDYEQTAPTPQFKTDERQAGTATAHRFIREGHEHFARGDMEGARKAAAHAVKLSPSSAQAHTLLALVEDRGGNAGSAGRHYLKAAELAPTQGAMLNNYGTWLCAQGRGQESLEWFDRALADRSYSSPSVAMANAGACAYRVGRHERAGTYLEGALELDPKNPVALGVMANREYRAGNAFRARAFSQRRLAAAPADAAALILASQIEEALGDKAAAARYRQQLRVEFPAASGTGTGDGGTR